MGLIHQEIEIPLNSNNIPYFEGLGYTIPRSKDKDGKLRVPLGTTLKIKTTDLRQGSHFQVWVKCDNCEKIYKTLYRNYVRYQTDGLIYCCDCASKVKNSGEKNHNYNPEISQEEREKGRNYPEYREFILKVLKRDNYTCQCCNVKAKNIVVHHLDGYHWCKEKRTQLSNGITLCESCHKNFHSIYGNQNNTKEQFEEWLPRTLSLIEEDIPLSEYKQIFCLETNKTYNSIYDVIEQFKFSLKDKDMIYKCCNRNDKVSTVKDFHFLWYKDYLKLNEEEVKQILKKRSRHKKVICLNTGKVFDQLKLAGEYYSVAPNSISLCCSGKAKTAGKLNGVPLTWMSYQNFLELSQDEQEKILNKEEN